MRTPRQSRISDPAERQQPQWSRRGVLTALGALPVAAALTAGPGGTAQAAEARRTLTASVIPRPGATYGVGMPVSITFSHAVADRAAVERAITVSADPGVEVAGHWFGDRRLDFRPRTYWAPDTAVTVDLRLKDVKAGERLYGARSERIAFRIGRSQISTVDLAKKRMTVVRDGRTVAAYPVTGGNADHTSWSGIMVISERLQETRMESSTVGLGHEYDIPDVPHAQRLTTSGTFIHGNYWTDAEVFGRDNTTHGCIGLHDAKGGDDEKTAGHAFFAGSRVGDVVVVRNSGGRAVDPANGLCGWNMAWKTWTAGSALR
ncbi:L,D-transpeptidase [Streptomyces poriticola]|uniref:L,D-transpeptidase n=1 Tax=Streptomyces poriticola TaxID=3120506 RepID=UPI002FCE479B